MPEKKPDNIFDAAGKSYGSSKKKKKPSEAGSSDGKQAPQDKPEVTASTQAMSTEELFKRTQDRYEELKAQGRQILENAGVDPQRLSQYLSNPSNFTPTAWQALEKTRDEEERALAHRVGRAAMRAAEEDKHAQK